MNDDHIGVFHDLMVDFGIASVGNVDHIQRKYILEDSDSDKRDSLDDSLLVFIFLEVSRKNFIKEITFTFFMLDIMIVVKSN
jgi:hypothetical protein